MSTLRTWFARRLVEPGTIISLQDPQTQWRVIELQTEQESQLEGTAVQGGSHPSYAIAKLLCQKVNNPPRKAFIRLYLQIPHAGTESKPTAVRAQAVTTYLPDELNALRSLTSQGSTITPQ